MKQKLIYAEESYQIIGACMEVHKVLGCGFLEPVYQEALENEFKIKNIQYEREKMLKIYYKNIELNKKYYADFICFGSIILEIKALSRILPAHEAQLINYLKATGYKTWDHRKFR
jgi:GxxExxY protein